MAVLTDGFPTFVNFQDPRIGGGLVGNILAGVAGVIYREHTVTPPGLDSMGPNDTSSMRNKFFRTKQPKQLVTMTEFKMECFYDPIIYFTGGPFWIIFRTNTCCFVAFPDGSGTIFWGWLDKMVPKDISEGTAPLAEANIQCGNQAFVAAGTAVPGVAGGTPAFGGPKAPGAPIGGFMAEFVPGFISNVGVGNPAFS